MKPRRLDDQIRDFYERQELSPEARARIRAMMQSGPESHRARRTWYRTAVAAAIVVSIATASLWIAATQRPTGDRPEHVATRVAQFAATAHNRQQELEFRGERADDLRNAMKSLDFTPVEPEMMSQVNMRLVGARYTTIEGVLAAQILYVDPKGEACTLYQARPVETLAHVPPGEHVVDGLRVSVWREKGLLMVLARPVA